MPSSLCNTQLVEFTSWGADEFGLPCCEDQPNGSVQHRLQSVQKVRRDTGNDRVAVVDLDDHQRTNYSVSKKVPPFGLL